MQAARNKGRKTSGSTDGEAERQTGRTKDRQAGRGKDRQTGLKTDRGA